MRLALAGDTMLGRSVGEAITRTRRAPLDDDVIAAAAEADLFVLNLECCVSARGQRWASPLKPFFFRAPPIAAELLAEMGVDCVSLANNHALDYDTEALLDTFEHLRAAGVAWTGAGQDVATARTAHVLTARNLRLAVIGAADHPGDYAAGPHVPGIAYADLRIDPRGEWLAGAIAAARERADAVPVTGPLGAEHDGSPAGLHQEGGRRARGGGATLVAGHSSHLFHGAAGRVLYDLGDFVDDYAVDRRLRNDLGLLFLVELGAGGPRTLEAIPLKLEFCRTRFARGEDASWISRRFVRAFRELGTEVAEHEGRLVATLRG